MFGGSFACPIEEASTSASWALYSVSLVGNPASAGVPQLPKR